MGVVYEAVHSLTGQEVALKTVRVARSGGLTSIRREIHGLTRLHHPGVVQCFDHGLENGVPWYTMELLRGQTVADLIVEIHGGSAEDGEDATETAVFEAATVEVAKTPAPVAQVADRRIGAHLHRVCTLARRLCAVLSFIHGKGVVHRDLKPSNIFIRTDGSPVLVDFGLISHFGASDGRETLEVTGMTTGTPAYMPPEQIRGESADARADLYSFGCLFYELLTGRSPFSGVASEVIQQHLGAKPLAPSRFIQLPDKLDRVVLQLLRKSRRRRLGHADDVVEVLRELGLGEEDADPDEAQRGYLFQPEIAGRAEVRNRLVKVLDRSCEGQGQMILLGGESGIGKTYLASSLTAKATALGMRVVTGRCVAMSAREHAASELRSSPLRPFAQLFHTVSDLCLEGGPEVTQRLLGPRGRVLSAFEPSFAELPGLEDYAEPAELPPEGARERVLSMLADVVSEVAEERPLLLVIDDLHLADELTERFLVSLADDYFASRKIVLLATYRTDEMTGFLRRKLRSAGVMDVQLGRLDSETIGSMAGDMLGLRRAPEELVDFLMDHSQGNPFFVAEYLRAAVAEEFFYRKRGRWRIGSLEDGAEGLESLPLPKSLRDIVGRRIAGLSGEATRLAEAAAVFGVGVEPTLLLDVVETSEDRAFDALTELLDRQVLHEGADGELAFVHQQILDASLDQVAPERLSALHRAAARSIERLYSTGIGIEHWYNQLAHHWRLAGDRDKTFEYLEKAGQRALESSAYVDAVGLLEQALEMGAEDASSVEARSRARWERQVGEAYLGLNNRAASREHLSQAASLLGWPMPRSGVGLNLGLAGQVLLQAYLRLVPVSTVGDRQKLDTVAEGVHTFELLQDACRSTGDVRLALYAMLRSLNLCERSDSHSARAKSYGLAQVLVGSIPLRRLAEKYGQLAWRETESSNDLNAHSFVLVMSSVYHWTIGNWERAVSEGEEALRMADQIGFRRRQGEAMLCMLSGHFEPGWFRRAEQLAVGLERLCKKKDERFRMWALTVLVQVRLRQGDLEGAAERAKELERFLRTDLDPIDRIIARAPLALVCLRQGDDATAQELADGALACVKQVPSAAFELLGTLCLLQEIYFELIRKAIANAASDRGALEESLHYLFKRARGFARAVPIITPTLYYWRGRYEWARGRRSSARRLWQQSLGAAQALEMPYPEARARLTIAEHCEDAAAAGRHRSQALAILENLSPHQDGGVP
jgi:tetratricopeptide (TPR) repeat protein